MVTRGDFAKQIRNVFAIVRPIDARDEKVAPAMRAASGIDGEPVGVSLIEFLGCAAGVHARENGDAICAGGAQEVAKEIAVAKELGAAVEWVFAGIIGNDSASVDDDALDASAFPVIPPPRNIVTSDVEFGDVGLAPPKAVAIPGGRLSLGGIVAG